MAIEQPGKHPAQRFRRSRVLGGKLVRGRRATNAELNVVAMVDVMTLLVIFLLQQFSATGEVLYLQKDIKLPEARHGQAIEAAPVVAISGDHLVLTGVKIADLGDLEKDPFLAIPALEERLREEKRRWEYVHQNDPDRERSWRGELNLQADRKVPFRVVKRVMYSAAQAGYPNVNFAAIEASGDSAAP